MEKYNVNLVVILGLVMLIGIFAVFEFAIFDTRITHYTGLVHVVDRNVDCLMKPIANNTKWHCHSVIRKIFIKDDKEFKNYLYTKKLCSNDENKISCLNQFMESIGLQNGALIEFYSYKSYEERILKSPPKAYLKRPKMSIIPLYRVALFWISIVSVLLAFAFIMFPSNTIIDNHESIYHNIVKYYNVNYNLHQNIASLLERLNLGSIEKLPSIWDCRRLLIGNIILTMLVCTAFMVVVYRIELHVFKTRLVPVTGNVEYVWQKYNTKELFECKPCGKAQCCQITNVEHYKVKQILKVNRYPDHMFLLSDDKYCDTSLIVPNIEASKCIEKHKNEFPYLQNEELSMVMHRTQGRPMYKFINVPKKVYYEPFVYDVIITARIALLWLGCVTFIFFICLVWSFGVRYYFISTVISEYHKKLVANLTVVI